MRRISGWVGLAAITLTLTGCFPAVDKGDVSESDVDTSGPDTSEAGDTGPQADTSAVDTVTVDTATPDTQAPDAAVTDTVAPECDGPEDCGHLAGTCTKVVCLGGTCAAQPDSGGSCDDGDACTRDDVCAGFTCAGTAYACDDGEACTDDVCDGAGGCDYPVKADGCWIAGACYAIGDTKPGDSCRVCAGGESWSENDGATCSDGDDVCTLGDTCDGTQCIGGPPPDDSVGDWARSPLRATGLDASDVTAVATSGSYLFWGGSYEHSAMIHGILSPATAEPVLATATDGRGIVIVQDASAGRLVRASASPASAAIRLQRRGSHMMSLVGLTGAGSVAIDGQDLAVSDAASVLVTLDPLNPDLYHAPVVIRGAEPWSLTTDATGDTVVGLYCADGCEIDGETITTGARERIVIAFDFWMVERWRAAIRPAPATTSSTFVVQVAALASHVSILTFVSGGQPAEVVDGQGVVHGLDGDIAVGGLGFFRVVVGRLDGAFVSAQLLGKASYPLSTSVPAGPTFFNPSSFADHRGFPNGDTLTSAFVGSGATVHGLSLGEEVVAHSLALGEQGFALMRHTPSGELVWFRLFAGQAHAPPAVAVSGDDVVVASDCCVDGGPGYTIDQAGTVTSLQNTGRQNYVALLNGAGEQIWTSYRAPSGLVHYLATDLGANDDVLAAGWFTGVDAVDLGPASNPLLLSGTSQYNSAVVRLNSAGGLACGVWP